MTGTERTLRVRELQPGGRAALAFEFRRLGHQSRRQGFLGAKTQLTDAELDRLLDVDHWHHEALIAFSLRPRMPVGTSRYVRAERFDVAEIAIEVIDQCQRCGVGRTLAFALRDHAVRAGIRLFTATTEAHNGGALSLARELGATTITAAHGAHLELLIDLEQ